MFLRHMKFNLLQQYSPERSDSVFHIHGYLVGTEVVGHLSWKISH